VTGEEKVNTWTQTGEEKINTWTQTGEEKVNTWRQRGVIAIFTINCENQDSNSRPWALIPCQASCISQRNQKSELMERDRQFTYTLQHPHSRVTKEEQLRPGREPAKQRPGRTGGDGHEKSQHVDTKGGNSNFYNKLRKPGFELETLGSDTMSSFMH
jgi:hypothetical protein